jgi:hypothetical protein
LGLCVRPLREWFLGAKRPPSTHFSSQVDIIERSTFIASLEHGRSKLAKPRLRVIP